jgi:hypothetical protein
MTDLQDVHQKIAINKHVMSLQKAKGRMIESLQRCFSYVPGKKLHCHRSTVLA